MHSTCQTSVIILKAYSLHTKRNHLVAVCDNSTMSKIDCNMPHVYLTLCRVLGRNILAGNVI